MLTASDRSLGGSVLRPNRKMNRKGKKKNPHGANHAGLVLAEWTGLEPATPGVTGRYSNQLNYHSLVGCSQNDLVGKLGI